jgi:hypothetical protein
LAGVRHDPLVNKDGSGRCFDCYRVERTSSQGRINSPPWTTAFQERARQADFRGTIARIAFSQ